MQKSSERITVLVTGANGQLGREMRRAAAGSKDRYVFTDVTELDIADADAVGRTVREEKADVIVNCAAYTNVDRAEEDETAADLLNHRAVANLATAARERGAMLIHISTDYVFRGDKSTPYAEDDPTDRLSALPSVADRYRDHASFPVASGRDARPGERNSDFKTRTTEKERAISQARFLRSPFVGAISGRGGKNRRTASPTLV